MANKKNGTDVLFEIAAEMHKDGHDYAMLDGKLYLYIFTGDAKYGSLVLDNSGKWCLE